MGNPLEPNNILNEDVGNATAATIKQGLNTLQYLNPDVANHLIIGAAAVIVTLGCFALWLAYNWFKSKKMFFEKDRIPTNQVTSPSHIDSDGSVVKTLSSAIQHIIIEQNSILQSLNDNISRNSESMDKFQSTFNSLFAKMQYILEVTPDCSTCTRPPLLPPPHTRRKSDRNN